MGRRALRALGWCGCTVFALLALVGCMRPSEQSPDHPLLGVNPDGTPKWVRKGSGAYDGDHGKALYGVGLVSGIRNLALLRQTADNRARGEVAKLFDVYVTAMMKDYQRATTAGAGEASAEEQDVVAVQQTLTETALRGVELRDRWRDPVTGAEYALAVLPLDGIKQSVEAARQLDAQVRDHVRRNAARAFDELDTALRQRDERGR